MATRDMNVEIESAVFKVRGLGESQIQAGISNLMTHTFQEGLVLDVDGETAVYVDKDKETNTYSVSAYFKRLTV